MATAGFGAQVTVTTPIALKNFLGGGAYTLSGLVQAINFQPYAGKVTVDNRERMANVVVGAVCNGRNAGGGQPDVVMPINLDGEPISASRLTIKVVPGAIKLVLPNQSSVLINHRKAT